MFLWIWSCRPVKWCYRVSALYQKWHLFGIYVCVGPSVSWESLTHGKPNLPLFPLNPLTAQQQTFAHVYANTCRYCTDTHTQTHLHLFSSSSEAEIFCSSHSWREILNNKYPANNECAAGCSCLGGIISNFLPMFHIPTPACRHSPSLHPNAGSYHFYLFFKSIYKSKPRQMRSNKLQSAGQMQNVNCVPGGKSPMGAAWSAWCATQKSIACHIKSHLSWILLSAVVTVLQEGKFIKALSEFIFMYLHWWYISFCLYF